jgi:hypothetical protein
VRDTVRDTVYSKLIRTDKYKGGCQIDYVGGGQEYSPNSTADVSFFTNDSTCVTIHYRVGDTNPFQFSIVSGHYSIPTNMTSGRALFVTPDSLYSDGMEKTGSLSQRSFVFKGKL